MNYYLRTQRRSEGYAARVFEELYPKQVARRAVAEFLSQVLGHAGSLTSAWSITLDPDSVRINIGPVQLLDLREGDIWFCIKGSKLRGAPKWLRDCSSGDVVYPRSVNVPSRQFRVVAHLVEQIPPSVRLAAFQYVEEAAARRKGKSSWVRSHSPGVLDFLESYLGIQLPRPAQEDSLDEFVSDTLDELPEGGRYPEGALIRVTRNAFERNRTAREACLARYGHRCAICEISLAERYGPIALELIHVHHLVSLSEIRQAYKVDAERDLRPLCPNCHAVVHLRKPPLSPEEVRALLRGQN